MIQLACLDDDTKGRVLKWVRLLEEANAREYWMTQMRVLCTDEMKELYRRGHWTFVRELQMNIEAYRRYKFLDRGSHLLPGSVSLIYKKPEGYPSFISLYFCKLYGQVAMLKKFSVGPIYDWPNVVMYMYDLRRTPFYEEE